MGKGAEEASAKRCGDLVDLATQELFPSPNQRAHTSRQDRIDQVEDVATESNFSHSINTPMTCRRLSFSEIYTQPWSRSWPAQANHIFNSLGITSRPEDYCRHGLDFPAYWSLDASSGNWLSGEGAGYPWISTHGVANGGPRKVMGWQVYAGLRQLHEAKGFDTHSREVARELRCLRYRVSWEQDALFARKAVSSINNSPGSGSFDDTNVDASATSPDRSIEEDISEEEEILPNNEGRSGSELQEESANVEGSPESNVEIFIPSRSWNIVTSVQLPLIVILSAFSVYDYR
ncbi:hypothetical protein B0H13DRAFT_2576999 [Mycena leptocephala]|nr:hypothetical protein B0H13DRAFT_2576999 [Mycena leptocephala]